MKTAPPPILRRTYRAGRQVLRISLFALLIAFGIAFAIVWGACWIAATLLAGTVIGTAEGFYEAAKEVLERTRREIRLIAADLEQIGL